jgi:hypothetical protein
MLQGVTGQNHLTMETHRFILEPYKGLTTRHDCPECNRKKTFTQYIDTETNQPIACHVGRCERIDNCGYHLTPSQYFKENNVTFDNTVYPAPTLPKKPIVVKETSYIPFDLFQASLADHENNHFITYLLSLFDLDTVNDLIETYYIGSSKQWKGATMFWQMDINWQVRTGKIMLYDPTQGKRVKEPFNHFTWAHSLLKLPDYNLRQCLFGEHLLNESTKPIAIVESEKTAIIASVYLPQYTWLACGGIQGLSADKCLKLKSKKVVLYPDLNAFEKWSVIAKQSGFEISDLLEKHATPEERVRGLDLADYLVRFNIKDFNPKGKTHHVSTSYLKALSAIISNTPANVPVIIDNESYPCKMAAASMIQEGLTFTRKDMRAIWDQRAEQIINPTSIRDLGQS